MSDNIAKAQEFWKDYANAFIHPLTTHGILGNFVTNPNVTGPYAEAWVKSMAKSMLHGFRISTGTVISASDRMREQENPQCDLIIWDPTIMPALFEKDDFALVPIHSVRAIIEVKRRSSDISDFEAQLRKRQKVLYYEYRKYVIGVLVSHQTQPFHYEIKDTWLADVDVNKPPIARLLDNKNQADSDGIFAFIYFLSQVATLLRSSNRE